MSILLNQYEIRLLKGVDLDSIADKEFRSMINYLDLLLDEESGELELTNALFDQIRHFAFHGDDHGDPVRGDDRTDGHRSAGDGSCGAGSFRYEARSCPV